MLPEIINSKLARGAFVLAKNNAIVEHLTSIRTCSHVERTNLVLAGDHMGVALKICLDLVVVRDYSEEHIQATSGPDLARLGDFEFHAMVKHCKIFAKFTLS